MAEGKPELMSGSPLYQLIDSESLPQTEATECIQISPTCPNEKLSTEHFEPVEEMTTKRASTKEPEVDAPVPGPSSAPDPIFEESKPKKRKMKVEEVWEIEKPFVLSQTFYRTSDVSRSKTELGFKTQHHRSPIISSSPSIQSDSETANAKESNQSMDKALSDLWAFLGAHFMAAGEIQTAMKYSFHALKKYEFNVSALTNLGSILDELGQTYEAFIFYMRALVLGGDEVYLIPDSIISRVSYLQSQLDYKMKYNYGVYYDNPAFFQNLANILFKGGLQFIREQALSATGHVLEDSSVQRENSTTNSEDMRSITPESQSVFESFEAVTAASGHHHQSETIGTDHLDQASSKERQTSPKLLSSKESENTTKEPVILVEDSSSVESTVSSTPNPIVGEEISIVPASPPPPYSTE